MLFTYCQIHFVRVSDIIIILYVEMLRVIMAIIPGSGVLIRVKLVWAKALQSQLEIIHKQLTTFKLAKLQRTLSGSLGLQYILFCGYVK